MKVVIKPEACSDLTSVELLHPRSNRKSFFFFDTKNENLLICQKSASNGSTILLTPFDLTFILLPLLDMKREKNSDSLGKFLTIDDIFFDNIEKNLYLFAKLNKVNKCLSNICDMQLIGDQAFFRLSDEKVKNWLNLKFETVLNNYEKLKFFETSIQQESCMSEEEKKESRVKIVAGLISDNLSLKWEQFFYNLVGVKVTLTTENDNKPPLSEYTTLSKEEPPQKKLNSGKDSVKTLKKKTSLGISKLEKASKRGMKSLATFFKK
ncbi:hypothetical protein HDU92_006418 [Lobulomyces angularis]|nr:hypothetical protein HDU92_006418 [Lobulomyces angularis]